MQVRKFAPPLHHILKSFAMLRNNVKNYKLLITFAIYQQTSNFQHIPNIPKLPFSNIVLGTENRVRRNSDAVSFCSPPCAHCILPHHTPRRVTRTAARSKSDEPAYRTPKRPPIRRRKRPPVRKNRRRTALDRMAPKKPPKRPQAANERCRPTC